MLEKAQDPTINNILDSFLNAINVIYKPGFLEYLKEKEKDFYISWIKNEEKIESMVKEIDAGLSDYTELSQLLDEVFIIFKTKIDTFEISPITED